MDNQTLIKGQYGVITHASASDAWWIRGFYYADEPTIIAHPVWVESHPIWVRIWPFRKTGALSIRDIGWGMKWLRWVRPATNKEKAMLMEKLLAR